MKKTGIELFESADINVSGDPLMMQTMEEMHEEALEMHTYRAMSADEAHEVYRQEQARKPY